MPFPVVGHARRLADTQLIGESRILMPSLTKGSLLVASPDQVSADISPDLSGEVVILQLKDGVYYELNETGARVWQLIQEPCTLGAVLEALLAEYEVDSQQCEADLMMLVEDMAGHGLIEIGDGSDP
jgi:hypothetical protein